MNTWAQNAQRAAQKGEENAQAGVLSTCLLFVLALCMWVISACWNRWATHFVTGLQALANL